MKRYGNKDWDAAKQRWAAYWSGSKTDRPVAVIFAWDDPNRKPPPFKSLEQKYTDIEYLRTAAERQLENTHCLGENFATVRLNLGPVCLARVFGSQPGYGDTTIWHNEIAGSVPDALALMTADPSAVDRRLDDMMGLFSFFDRIGLDSLDALPACPDLGGPVDTVMQLVGSSQFCADIVSEPDACVSAIDISAARYNQAAKRLVERLGPRSSDWLNLYCDDGYFTIGEDISAMISPRMVRRFVVPALNKALDGVSPNVVFHWHSGAMKTLDAFLEMDAVSVLQWTSDINHMLNPPSTHLDEIRKIMDAGKKLFVYIEPDEIPAFAAAFPAENIAFGFNAKRPEDGEKIIRQLESAYKRD